MRPGRPPIPLTAAAGPRGTVLRSRRGDEATSAHVQSGTYWDGRFANDGSEKPKVTPTVACQSGAPRLRPRRIPASKNTFDEVGCQMKPSKAELSGSSPCVLSPFTSPTSRRLRATGSSPITPQTQNGRASARSMPPPLFTWTVKGDTCPLTIPMASNPTPCSPRRVEGKSGPASIAMLTPDPSLQDTLLEDTL